MNIFALILAIIAVVLVAIEYSRTKSLFALGVAVFIVAWILQLILLSGTPIVVR